MHGPDKITNPEWTLINGSTKLQGSKQDFNEDHFLLTGGTRRSFRADRCEISAAIRGLRKQFKNICNFHRK